MSINNNNNNNDDRNSHQLAIQYEEQFQELMQDANCRNSILHFLKTVINRPAENLQENVDANLVSIYSETAMKTWSMTCKYCEKYLIEYLVENQKFKSIKNILSTAKILPGFIKELNEEKLLSKNPIDVEKAKNKQMPGARFKHLVCYSSQLCLTVLDF